jgi:3-oxoadipate enol-lactonase
MPKASVNGTELYFESNGEGPAILFAHGAGGNHLSWWQQVPEFSKQYRCVTFDHRAFGQSVDANGEGRTAFARDVLALLDHLGLERVFVVAQSMGGRTAAGLVRNAADRVRALVLAGTLGGAVGEETETIMREFRASLPAGLTLLDRALGQRIRKERPELAFLYYSIARLNPQRPSDFLAPRPGYRGSTASLYAESGIPILFLAGEEDRIVPPAAMEAAHRLVPGSSFAVVPDAGHSAYFEQPQRFNEIVGLFLREHELG